MKNAKRVLIVFRLGLSLPYEFPRVPKRREQARRLFYFGLGDIWAFVQ
jgi:hypothetical protein